MVFYMKLFTVVTKGLLCQISNDFITNDFKTVNCYSIVI